MRNIYGIMDDHGESFKEYLIKNNMPEKIQQLKKGLDDNSCEIIDLCLHRMLHLPDLSTSKYFYVDFDEYMKWIETDRERFFRESYEFSLPNYKKKYDLDGESYNPDTFLFHHGLFFANKKIKDYIQNKIFIDGGSFIGDSALILAEYKPKKIYSFDLSEINVEKYKKIMEINKIPENLYDIIHMGLSDKSEEIKINDCGGQGVTLLWEGNKFVQCTSIDEFTKTLDEKVGFIKCDLEGNGLKALNGMKETIIRDRPVLTLAIYHNPEEFFEMKPLLEKITKDLKYSININHYHCFCDFLAEVAIFAYPAELQDEEKSQTFRFERFKEHPLYKTLKRIWDE